MVRIEELTGRVLLQSSPDYDEARKNYNGRFNKFPKVIVYCEVTEDVVNAILWARKQQLPFRVRSGGHSYEAFSLVDDGLIIDVSGLIKLQINKENGTAQIGAGFRLLPLYEALWNQRVTIPFGTCPTIGVSGITLGGGYGLLSRLLGMTCDNVLEVEMVTAQGKIIRANDSQHSNLFWACRGGGDGSFGVITSFIFRVHPIEKVTRYRITWDFADLEKVMRYWQTWAPHADARLASLLLFPAQTLGDLRANGVFVGSEQELRQIIRPLQKATRPKTVEFQSTTWIEAARLFAGRPVKQEKFKHSSAYVYEPLSDAALGVLTQYLQNAPGPINVIAFDAYGGAISQVPIDATAFAHRNALFVIQYQSYWVQDEDEKKNIQWIEQFRNSMLPYTRGAFRDYCDTMIPNWATAYFEENLVRLKKVKQMYDPENLFRFEQSIPK
ncbi:FAD-binding oxidoreductase [Bacillus sp. Bva_UNVM-123]|uniref:FAD-binding oxidoreductase n=1 Tax=Bacillus sp. Bva_UNVM-123 TaxID=2829798 RepID=UPI00391F9322